jgi:hypothetical protein
LVDQDQFSHKELQQMTLSVQQSSFPPLSDVGEIVFGVQQLWCPKVLPSSWEEGTPSVFVVF